MGVGKSTIGNILSKELKWHYYDNDTEMTIKCGFSQEELSSMPVQELHALESRYLNDILLHPAPFITGAAGSVVDYPENFLLLRTSTSIYLRIPLSEVIARAGRSGVGRQAIIEKGEEILVERFERRDPLYQAAAKFTVQLGTNPELDVYKIINFLTP